MQRAMAVERGILAEKKGNHSENGDAKGSRKRVREGKSAKESEASVAVKDEEVEEFFTILKRIQGAKKHIEKLDGGGNGCKWIEEMLRSKPSLSSITEETKVDFDLNVDPAQEFD